MKTPRPKPGDETFGLTRCTNRLPPLPAAPTLPCLPACRPRPLPVPARARRAPGRSDRASPVFPFPAALTIGTGGAPVGISQTPPDFFRRRADRGWPGLEADPVLPFDAAALDHHRHLVARMATGETEALQDTAFDSRRTDPQRRHAHSRQSRGSARGGAGRLRQSLAAGRHLPGRARGGALLADPDRPHHRHRPPAGKPAPPGSPDAARPGGRRPALEALPLPAVEREFLDHHLPS